MNVLKELVRYWLFPNWIIGIGKGSLQDGRKPSFDNVIWLKTGYHDRWFADPFIVDEIDNQLVILAEEFCYSDNKGKIVSLWVDKNKFKVLKRKELLKLSTHLSFPIYHKEADDTYIYPENSESLRLDLYKLSDEYDELTFKKTIIEKSLSDSVVFNYQEKWFLITTEKPFSCGNEVKIFISNEPFGNYTLHQNISLKDNSARRAGAIINSNGKYISVSQECNRYYGEGLVFSEVHINSKFEISFQELFRLKSKSRKIKGIHTYNEYRDLYVIDAKIVRMPLLGTLISNSKIIFVIKKVLDKIRRLFL